MEEGAWQWLLPMLRKLQCPILDPAFADTCRNICMDGAHAGLQNVILQKLAAGKDLDIKVSGSKKGLMCLFVWLHSQASTISLNLEPQICEIRVVLQILSSSSLL